MPTAEAVRNLPVILDATVLYHDPVKQEFFLDDGTATCFANTTIRYERFPPGTRLAIEGVTVHIGLFPHFQIRSARVIGRAPLPEPYAAAIEELMLPELDSRRIRFPAVVTGVEPKGLGYTLVLQVAGYEFKADLPPVTDADERAAALMQRPVVVTGFAATVFNDDMQMTGRHFFVGSFDDIEPTTSNRIAATARPVAIRELLNSQGSPEEVVRVCGTITQHHVAGFYMADEKAATLVRAALPDRFPVGVRVEVVGYAAIAPYRPSLRAMSVDPLGKAALPAALPLPDESHGLALVKWTAYQNQLVQCKAELLAMRMTPEAMILQCKSGSRVFEAVLQGHGMSAQQARFSVRDQLCLTGICELTTSRPIPRHDWIEGFRILLPGPDAVKITHKAPWWTQEKLIAALGITAAAALVAFIAAALLKRQVNHQLQIISGKIRQESISSERDRIARELHDSLEQNLTGLALQIEGIDDAIAGQTGAVGRRIAVIRHMLRHTRSEARKSVWDLRSNIPGAEGLGSALQAMESLPAGPDCTVKVHMADPLPKIPAQVAYHLLRIAQEAHTNAVKHAKAGNIDVILEPEPSEQAPSRSWRLMVKDDGIGFDPTAPVDQDLPHFGFIGMQERAARMGGDLRIESAPGGGCRVILSFSLDPLQWPNDKTS